MRAVFLLALSLLTSCSSPEKATRLSLGNANAQSVVNSSNSPAAVNGVADEAPQGRPPVWFNANAAGKAATLKRSIDETVTGEYAYADLESLLAFIGKVENVEHEVHRIEFFHGFAARVSVEGVSLSHVHLHCAAVNRHEWRLVGFTSSIE
jgi:hypothetical protein